MSEARSQINDSNRPVLQLLELSCGTRTGLVYAGCQRGDLMVYARYVVLALSAVLVSQACSGCDDGGNEPWTFGENEDMNTGTGTPGTGDPSRDGSAVPGSLDEPDWAKHPAAPWADATVAHRGVGNTYILDYAEDVDGDGDDEVLVGDKRCCRYAPLEYARHHGAVYLLYGGPWRGLYEFGPGEYQTVFVGAQDGDSLGSGVAGLGDVDGDGLGDFVIGADRWEARFMEQGSATKTPGLAYVFYGREDGFDEIVDVEDEADAIIVGDFDNLIIGATMVGLDFDGDGYRDLVLSGFHEDPTGPSARLFVFYGGPSSVRGSLTTSAADVIIEPPDDSLYFGWSLARIGDLNGDGSDELLVGLPGDERRDGRAVIVFGDVARPAGVLSAADLGLLIEATSGGSETFAQSVGGPGDLDGDGTVDFVIGQADIGLGQYMYSSGASVAPDARGSVVDRASLQPTWTSGEFWQFPHFFSDGGDLDGDGHADLVVSGSDTDGGPGGPRRGIAAVFYGGAGWGAPDTVDEADLTLWGVSSEWGADGIGALSTRGDLNGDAFDDLVISGQDKDRLYIMYGERR